MMAVAPGYGIAFSSRPPTRRTGVWRCRKVRQPICWSRLGWRPSRKWKLLRQMSGSWPEEVRCTGKLEANCEKWPGGGGFQQLRLHVIFGVLGLHNSWLEKISFSPKVKLEEYQMRERQRGPFAQLAVEATGCKLSRNFCCWFQFSIIKVSVFEGLESIKSWSNDLFRSCRKATLILIELNRTQNSEVLQVPREFQERISRWLDCQPWAAKKLVCELVAFELSVVVIYIYIL